MDPKNKASKSKSTTVVQGTGVGRAKPARFDKYRNAYLQTLYDPVGTTGVGIPDDFIIPSQKLHTIARFTGTTGTNQTGFVACNPHFLGFQDSNAIFWSGANYAGNTITNAGTGVFTGNTNSSYNVAGYRRNGTNSINASSFSAGKRIRLVSCVMRVESMASVVSNFGEMAGLVTPLHESLIGHIFDNLTTYKGHTRVLAKQGNAIELYYTPVWPSELQYHNLSDTNDAAAAVDACRWIMDPTGHQYLVGATYTQYSGATNTVSNECLAWQPFMGVIIGGCESGIPFRCDIECNYEITGYNVGQLATPSPYSATQMNDTRTISSVAPTAMSAESGTPAGLGNSIINAAPKLLKLAEDVAFGMLPPPLSALAQSIKGLML